MLSRLTTPQTVMQFIQVIQYLHYRQWYADLVTGNISSYSETNFNRLNDIAYNTYEGFVQDSWKITGDSRWNSASLHAFPAMGGSLG